MIYWYLSRKDNFVIVFTLVILADFLSQNRRYKPAFMLANGIQHQVEVTVRIEAQTAFLMVAALFHHIFVIEAVLYLKLFQKFTDIFIS